MCVFSQNVRHVSATRIFGRISGQLQYLTYEMRLVAETEVAMILPLPIRAGGSMPVTFIDLSDYPDFFTDLERCFPRPVTRSLDLGGAVAGAGSIPVHRVGAFDASFVPSLAEFGRLDPRFRLSDEVWRKLPYSDFGFAVFQLRPGDSRVHPMALSFTTRHPSAVFFPTAHVHDGAVHSIARFDHSLYVQGALESADWKRGSVLPGDVMDFGNRVIADRTRGIVEASSPVFGRELSGALPNGDTWVAVC
jgi:hypothetical protein